ncbi:MAG: Na+/H+ antiporter NhaA, partial [Actinomycetota bacterium]
VDDIGAIIVIALFYVGALHVEALFVALALLGVMALLRVLHVWWMPLYVMVGAGVWLATLESGVHATIAGVVLGLLAPPHPLRAYDMGSLLPRTDEERAGFGAAEARMTRYKVAASIPVTDRLLEILHPWAGFAILPLFALANAGVDLGLDELGSALGGSVAQGVALGLVVGKTGGILAASWLAVKLGARLPAGVTWRHMLGLSVIAGIGFTVSLFITGLAFSHATLVGQAKVGILFGSLVAALAGIAILRTGPRAEGGDAEAPEDGSE